MTDLLSRPPAAPPAAEEGRRPLVVAAAVAACAAVASVLAACAVVALCGWYAAEAGAIGTTEDALRVAADAWLLAQGSGLDLGRGTVVTAAPLGLTLLSAWAAFWFGRRAARRRGCPDLRTLAAGAAVMALVYGVLALLTAVLAATPTVQPRLVPAFLGGCVVGGAGGGLGLLLGSGLAPALGDRLPRHLRVLGRAAVVTVCLTFAAACVVVAAALLTHFGAAANVLTLLRADAADGLLSVVVTAAVAPNAALLASAYLLGPGFAIGTGTLVAPTGVVLGPVPAVPLLAALPDPGAAPWWVALLVAVPLLAATAGAVLASRAGGAVGYGVSALRGVGGGVAAGLLQTALVLLAGGSVGPGRMADVGAEPLEVALASVATMAVGGLLGAVAATWWRRRRPAGPR